MSVNNLQQNKHNRQEIIYNFAVMDYPFEFAKWLEDAFQQSRFKSYAALGEAAGLSRSTIASLAKAKPQTATNKASRPKRENVIAIAKALDADVDSVLKIAGHAPASDIQLIRNRIRVSDFDDFDEKDLDDIAEYIALKKLKNKQ